MLSRQDMYNATWDDRIAYGLLSLAKLIPALALGISIGSCSRLMDHSDRLKIVEDKIEWALEKHDQGTKSNQKDSQVYTKT